MRFLICLILFFSFSLHAASIQKWVDDDGNVHYGDAPPVNTKTESVRVQRAPSNPGRALPRLNTTPADDSATTTAQQDAERAEQMKVNCDRARQNLSTLNTSGRVKLREPDGEARYLNAEERAERVVQAENDIKTYCQ
jgi:hypothetical protein